MPTARYILAQCGLYAIGTLPAFGVRQSTDGAMGESPMSTGPSEPYPLNGMLHEFRGTGEVPFALDVLSLGTARRGAAV